MNLQRLILFLKFELEISMHITPYDNENKPLIDIDNPTVPLTYFNIIKLERGQSFTIKRLDMKPVLHPLQVQLT